MAIRLRPLRDVDADAALFVAPTAYDRLRAAVAQRLNVLVLGERGSGKTSVLRRLQHEIRAGEEGAAVAFADVAAADSPAAALEVVAYELAEVHGVSVWNVADPRPGAPEADRELQAALRRLEQLPPTTILVDNADPAAVAYPLFGVQRDRLWETPHHWVLAGEARQRPVLLRPPADAFWEEVVELDYTAEQALELLTRRLPEPAPAWAAELAEVVGPSPRQLLRAGLEALEDPEAALARQRDWRARVAALDGRSAMLLAELDALAPASASDGRLLERLGWSRTTLQRALEALEEEGFVTSWTEPTGKGRPRRVFAPAGPGGWGRG